MGRIPTVFSINIAINQAFSLFLAETQSPLPFQKRSHMVTTIIRKPSPLNVFTIAGSNIFIYYTTWLKDKEVVQ